jgi:O-antigen biosynthesis protein WbqP
MYRKYFKRLLDVVLSVLALIITFPISLVTAIAIKLTSPDGPIIFSHIRSGRNKKPFRLYKFRSTHAKAPANVPTAEADDSFFTPVGRFIRLFSIDEIPQFWNVIKGDMSIVGPRPVITREKRLINERDKYNANSVRPGIAGWAQVNGRDDVDWETKAKLDGEYVKKLSFLMDIKCLWLSAIAVVTRRGHKEKGAVAKRVKNGAKKIRANHATKQAKHRGKA